MNTVIGQERPDPWDIDYDRTIERIFQVEEALTRARERKLIKFQFGCSNLLADMSEEERRIIVRHAIGSVKASVFTTYMDMTLSNSLETRWDKYQQFQAFLKSLANEYDLYVLEGITSSVYYTAPFRLLFNPSPRYSF